LLVGWSGARRGVLRAPGYRDQRFHGIVITQNGAS
jgi:hypothetical protein